MLYSLLRKILFMLDPEQAHFVALQGLHYCQQFGLMRFFSTPSSQAKTIMGLHFPNLIGLAAGLDKNADYVDALSALGFGFIEIGTVTPKPQMGNPKPRLFRLVAQEALINRMGFNNKGMEYVADRLAKIKYRGILGINIGKNRDTPLEKAIEDYVSCFRCLAKFASYITVNISSPNTAGLRDLQQADLLSQLLTALKHEQQQWLHAHNKYIPLVVKISPDLSLTELRELADVLLAQQIDGVIATNTSIQREGLEEIPLAKEAGGLSGKPLQKSSTQMVRELHSYLQNKLPIIACGGIGDADSLQEKFQAGASLAQIYTGFIYQGPSLIKKLKACVE